MSNPFAAVPLGSEAAGGVSSNPFAPANPFAPSSSSSDERTTATTNALQQIKLSPLEYGPNSNISHIKNLLVHHDLALCICETSTTTGNELVLTRREMNKTFHARGDGALQLKDNFLTGAHMSPRADVLLLQQRAAPNAVFWCNPQEAQLKLRGPISGLSGNGPISAVHWPSTEGEEEAAAVAAVIAFSNGQGKQVLFSLQAPQVKSLFQLASPVCAMFAEECDSGATLVVFESCGKVHKVASASTSPHHDLHLDLLQVVRDEDDARVFWLLARHGLFQWRMGGSKQSLPHTLVFAQDNCFAMSHTRLFLLILSRQATRQSNAIETKLNAVSRITPLSNPVLVLERARLSGTPPPFAFARDTVLNKTWLVSDRTVILVEIQNEFQNAWRIYFDRVQQEDDAGEMNFQLALEYATAQSQRDAIFAAYADWHFARAHYMRSAELFAEIVSGKTFEEIALRLAPHKPALRTFLMGKLHRLMERGGGKKTLQVMLCTWICEIFLEELSTTTTTETVPGEEELVSSFCAFLGAHVDTLTAVREIVYHLLLSHGRLDVLLVYAHLNQDFDRVIAHHIAQQSWSEAVLALQDFSKRDVTLVYKYSPALIDHVPRELVKLVWEEESGKLDLIQLVPALSRVVVAHDDDAKENAALAVVLPFLETRLKSSNTSATVHNLLLSLYALRDEDEQRLFAYVRSQTNQAGGPAFDHGFALRLCETASPRARVILFDALNMPEAAVRAALTLPDMHEYAQRIAAMQVQNNAAFGKQLWLLCCEHAGGFQARLQVAKQSEGVLGVDDVLRLGGDAEDRKLTVEDVREDVCAALERHSAEIARLKLEMEEHTMSAQALRRDAHEEQQRFDVIRAAKHCDACGKRVLRTSSSSGGDLFVFPCTHVFHSTCLFHQVVAHLHGDRRERLTKLRLSNASEDQALFDEIIGASCPFCGEIMVQSVAQPLLFAKDEAEARTWE